MEDNSNKKIWVVFQKNIKNIFFIILGALVISDFFIHRHHHFKIGEFHLFEAAAGIVFIFILAVAANILRILFLKPENFYNNK